VEPIQDYALIGDCRAAALVSKTGAIDWLCWPRFDSSAVFGALLDPNAGSFRLCPVLPERVERRYRDGTNVLETRFFTATGSLRVTDAMSIAGEADQRCLLLPEHEIVRIAECESGEVELELLFDPRASYGRERPKADAFGKLGYRFRLAEGLLLFQSELPIRVAADGSIRATTRLRAGEVKCCSLSFAASWPAVISPLGEACRQAVQRSSEWWRSWSARLEYAGPQRAAVERSALTLKLLVYAPSGAVVAAPTTSLPERIGGDLNWDYRFCWLRDAALTVRALYGLGYAEEAGAFLNWLLHSTRLTQPKLRVLYDVFGNQPRSERVLEHLAGYRSSYPVRIGNGAADQLQLDVYGEVVEAAAQAAAHGGRFDRETAGMLARLGEYVCKHWQEPDHGIWEPRSGPAHNTHSRLMCWVTLTRLLELHEAGELGRVPAALFAKNQTLIAEEIRTRAWNPALGSYVSQLDGDELDASLLALAWSGFEDPASERMRRTYRCIVERLGAGNGLLYRYRNENSPGEGAFGICSFWGAEYLAMGGGSVQEASAAFDALCRYGNDLGLFAEEIEPATGAALGNFPQAFTHVGLINTALTLTRRLEGEVKPTHAGAA
jgi:GH15 family glucan-1,4-alpha-glucosidase